jgi:hypothetical protein
LIGLVLAEQDLDKGGAMSEFDAITLLETLQRVILK